MWLLRFLFAPELGRALADIGGASRRSGRSVRALSDEGWLLVEGDSGPAR